MGCKNIAVHTNEQPNPPGKLAQHNICLHLQALEAEAGI